MSSSEGSLSGDLVGSCEDVPISDKAARVATADALPMEAQPMETCVGVVPTVALVSADAAEETAPATEHASAVSTHAEPAEPEVSGTAGAPLRRRKSRSDAVLVENQTAQVAATTEDAFNYDYRDAAVCGEEEEACEETATEKNAVDDPYAYTDADIARAPFTASLGLEKGVADNHLADAPETVTSGQQSGEETDGVSRRVSVAAIGGWRRVSQPEVELSPAALGEMVRRRSYSSSPYAPVTPMTPLTAREAMLLELLESALELTNKLTGTVQELERGKPHRERGHPRHAAHHGLNDHEEPHAHAGRSHRSQKIVETQQGGVVASSHGVEVPPSAEKGSEAACETRIPCTAPLVSTAASRRGPRRESAAHRVAGGWVCQLREPEPRHNHGRAASSQARVGPARGGSRHLSHNHDNHDHSISQLSASNVTAGSETVLSRRAKGTFPFTSRTPARVPLNATNRFVVPHEKRTVRHNGQRAASASAPAAAHPSHKTARHTDPRASPSRPTRGASHRQRSTSPSAAARHVEQAHVPGSSSHRGGSQAPHQDDNAAPSCPVHGSRRGSAHRADLTELPASTHTSNVGSEYDYCLRQLRDDYCVQSHQVLEQLEHMLRHEE